MKCEFSLRIVGKHENMKFHVNPPIGSRDPCGRTDGRSGRDMTKLIIAFRNIANAPKNTHVYVLFLFLPSFPILMYLVY